MSQPSKLPASLLTELGRVVVIWAHIEQDILMQTSAMAALKTDGHPREFLRLDFKRLRETWYRFCRENFSPKIFKEAHSINTEIVRLAPFRHHAIHGTWSVIGRGVYELSIWEQKASLDQLTARYPLSGLRGLVAQSFDLARRVRAFTSSGHGSVDRLNALVPEEIAVVPFN
jgi:hypothetical protein